VISHHSNRYTSVKSVVQLIIFSLLARGSVRSVIASISFLISMFKSLVVTYN
jgi:hypothetical protein